MEYAPGDIFWSDFPSADAGDFKERPVLIVAKVFGDDVIVCMITTKKPRFDICIEISNTDFVEGGLATSPSFIRPVRLFTASPKIFRSKAGRVNGDVLNSVLEALSKKFNPIG